MQRYAAGERDFQRAVLSEADLRGVDLKGVDLTGALLGKADLTKANLIEVTLRDANLSKARLASAQLRKADLQGAALCFADLKKANLAKARLADANLAGADLTDANLNGADLSRADLGEAKLNRAALREANLSGADLERANLTKAELTEANVNGANLRHANLSHANLAWVDFARADLRGALVNLTEELVSVLSTPRPLAQPVSSRDLYAQVQGMQLERWDLARGEHGAQLARALELLREDPDMALGKSRKVLEGLLKEFYRDYIGGELPKLDGIIGKLKKADLLPDKIHALCRVVQTLGNKGAHPIDDAEEERDEITHREAHLGITAMIIVLEWYQRIVEGT